MLYIKGFDRVDLLSVDPLITSANYSRKDGRIFGGLVKHVLGSIKKSRGDSFACILVIIKG
jgi:hypothetical protein